MGAESELTGAAAIANSWLTEFNAATSSVDVEAVTALFLSTGWLRDVLTFSWTHRSLCGHDAISAFLSLHLPQADIRDVKLDEEHGVSPSFVPTPGPPTVEAAFTFDMPRAHGRGHIRLLQDHREEWKALTVFLTIEDLKGHEERQFENGIYEGRTRTWNEVQEERRARIETDPHVIIIGAAQTGLNVGARFRQMNIPTLLVERTSTVGDVWRERYPTLTLHTHDAHNSMLYQRYPRNWPTFTPRDKMASWLEQYALNQDLVVWTRTTIVPTPSYDPSTKRWTVRLLRDGKEVTLHPYHIVLAMGTLGKPTVPRLPGHTEFKGEAYHAATFKGGIPYAGKKAIVIGAGNTSADICQDLVARGAASVTMVQRSSTAVVTRDYVQRAVEKFWPWQCDTSPGDFRNAAMPLGLLKKIHITEKESRVEEHRDMLEGLAKAGFKADEGPEGAGQHLTLHMKLGGYMLDVGVADLIIKGKIHVKQGTEPVRFTPEGLVFKDGSTLDTDLVVFATGYGNIREPVTEMFGEEVAERTTPVWGMNEEGELNRCYTPSGHPGLWYALGFFHYSRFYSKTLALQIKAREIGLVTD